jgi:two-component system, NarL family, sensor kinase
MQLIKNFVLGAAAMFSCYLFTSAQTPAIDSMIRLLENARHDTTKIDLNYQLAVKLNMYDLVKADQYLEAGYAIAKKLNHAYYVAYYFTNKGGLLFDMAKYSDARVFFDSAIVLYDALLAEEKDPYWIAVYKYGKADSWLGKGLLSAKVYLYQESIQYYLESIAVMEGLQGNQRDERLANLYADIASDYYEMEDFANALKYDKEGLQFLKPDGEQLYVIGNLFVADDFSGLLQFDSSFLYIEKVRPIVERLNRPSLNVRLHYILGGIYRKKKEWDKALANYQIANREARRMSDDFQEVNSIEGMAASYLNLGDFAKGREMALEVLRRARSLHIPLFQSQALELLTKIEEKAGNINKAFEYQTQWMAVSDSMKKEKIQRQMSESEMKYQNERKAKEILQLQKDNAIQTLSLQKKSTFNYLLIGSLGVLLIIGFLGYRNFRNRQQLSKQQDELQRQQIRELEKDRQLIAVDSMLKGQEEERRRLAKDLHDGLGGLLSGVKFSLNNMKDNLIITPDNMTVFERSLDMLDTSIRELRRVAHNMMPEMLSKFGLDEAITEYISTINATKLVAVKYQSHGMSARIDKSAEIIIYRIIQELLNNIMKHSGATEAFVQLIKEEARLNIVVEDNGKGFEISQAVNTESAGLKNIQSRVDYLKGQLEIHSEPGKGTLVNIEFNI